MLDTSTAVELLRRPRPALSDRIATAEPGAGMISSVAVAELWYGAEKSLEQARNYEVVGRFLRSLEVVPFDAAAAQAYGPVRADLERRGLVIGPLDMLIAAHALSLDALLVTANVREFSRVRGLRVEDWGGEG